MSKSYKKSPVVTDYRRVATRKIKRFASKMIRRISVYTILPNGKAYTKYFPSWDICDYHFRLTMTRQQYESWKIDSFYWYDKSYDEYKRHYIKK